ncbi:MAG: MCP four helix bundle domain-containing protein [Chloroflexota bacterium]|nr:MCP four helix bundle domain-containing protein [Chloroflexota bacterium]
MRLSIRTKLMIGFVLILVAMAVVGWRDIVGMGDINKELNSISTDQFVPAKTIANANIALIAWNRAMLNHVLAESPENMDEYEQIMLEQKAIVLERLQTLSEAEQLSGRGKELVREVGANFQQAEPIRDRVVALSRAGEQEEGRQLIRLELRPIIDEVDVYMTEFLQLQERQLGEVMNTTDERYQQGLSRILWIIGIAIVISIFIALFLSNTIIKGINELVRGAKLAAVGDFKQAKVTVTSKDELGYLGGTFNEMLASVTTNISQREQAQEEVRKHRDHLEELVNERTAELKTVNEELRQDITERKRMEEEIKRTRDYLEKLNSSLKEVIFNVKFPERTIEYVNRAVETVFGYRPDECIGQNTEFLFKSNKDYLEMGRKLGSAIENNKHDLELEFQVRKKDGGVVDVAVNFTFIKEQGELTRAISVFRDVTERKQAEEKRIKLIQELQETLKEVRTLSGLLPICAWCKKLRDDEGYWKSVEQYIGERTKAEFTHGVCPECQSKFLSERNGNTKVS